LTIYLQLVLNLMEQKKECYCYNCQKRTIHIFEKGSIEKTDYRECLVCHHWMYGIKFFYSPPREKYKSP
jgi:peptide methionine sulfoxide reductase MsrB